MKILHAISSASPAGGGPIESVRQSAQVMQQLGHTVEVVALDDPGEAFLRSASLNIHAVGRGRTSYRFNPRYVEWLRRHGAEYDVVVVNGLWQYASFGAWQALHGTSTPYAVFTHGMLDPWFKRTYPLKHLKKCMYWPWAEYRVLRDAAAVLFTCETERRLARESFSPYRAKEVVVNFGTSAPPANADESLAAFRERYRELNGKRLVIFLGRLHEKKGCDLLLRAFARVLSPRPEWHLLMCGPGQGGEEHKLRALSAELGIAERITWTGMISGKMKWGALRAAEIFALTSHQENFGIVVAEALACGVPTLISDQVNISGEVAADGAGLVAPDTVEGACSLLQRWLAMSDAEHSAMRAKTVACFERRFEIQKAAENLLEVLQGVVEKK